MRFNTSISTTLFYLEFDSDYFQRPNFFFKFSFNTISMKLVIINYLEFVIEYLLYGFSLKYYKTHMMHNFAILRIFRYTRLTLLWTKNDTERDGRRNKYKSSRTVFFPRYPFENCIDRPINRYFIRLRNDLKT